ncbi:MAG: hypothetical protein PVI30_02215 [Myxococcales bacterium]|jgi:hypothetical protein
MRRSLLPWLGWLAIGLLGCSSDEAPLTQIMVSVTTDLQVPAELDGVVITVSTATRQEEVTSPTLASADALPVTLGVQHVGGPLEGVRVSVIGTRGGQNVIQREAETEFVRGEIRELRMDLLAGCVGEPCPGQTCGELGCQPVDVDGSTLPVWSGSADRDVAAPDASTPTDAGATADAAAPLDGGGGQEGTTPPRVECTSQTASLCPGAPGASPDCVDGRCGLRCDSGRADCNGDGVDGCEALLSAQDSCGACGITCAEPSPLCAPIAGGGYRCQARCDDGELCGQSCVDTTRDTAHCGGCDRPCMLSGAMPRCRDGECQIDACRPGFADCNDRDADGCEVDVQNDPMHCGGCSDACEPRLNVAEMGCEAGECRIAKCDEGFGDCDGLVESGCEMDLRSNVLNCGACGTTCATGRPCCDGECLGPGPPLCP